jgi:hypothetical protein
MYVCVWPTISLKQLAGCTERPVPISTIVVGVGVGHYSRGTTTYMYSPLHHYSPTRE